MHWQISLSFCPWYRPAVIHKNPPDRQTTNHLVPDKPQYLRVFYRALLFLTNHRHPVPDKPSGILFLTDSRASCSWQITSHSAHVNPLAIVPDKPPKLLSLADQNQPVPTNPTKGLLSVTDHQLSCFWKTSASTVPERPAGILFLTNHQLSSWQSNGSPVLTDQQIYSRQTSRSPVPGRPTALRFLTE